MANITVSLEKCAEEKLRELANKKYQNKKGSLARVIREALENLDYDSGRRRAMERQLNWMKKGFKMGKILIKERSEIYERS